MESSLSVNDQIMLSTVRVTKALGDTQRLRILSLLEHRELCVCQIIEVLGLAPSTVSKHLSLLSSAGLVVMRKEGRWAYYRLPDGPAADANRHLIEWLRTELQDASTVKRDRTLLEAVLALNLCDVARSQRRR